MSRYDELKRLVDRVLTDRRFCGDENHKALADGVLALIAESERLQGCEDVLRQLASYCGCGGYNAPEVAPEVFAKKIMDGINILNDPLMALADKRGVERDQLKAENEALLVALKGMTSMYGYCWDIVDGGLLCMQDNVQLFEDAHEAAPKVIAAIGKGEQT